MTILLVLQTNKNLLLSNCKGKEHQRPTASYSSVLVEGEIEDNIDDWFTICQTIYFALDA